MSLPYVSGYFFPSSLCPASGCGISACNYVCHYEHCHLLICMVPVLFLLGFFSCVGFFNLNYVSFFMCSPSAVPCFDKEKAEVGSARVLIPIDFAGN